MNHELEAFPGELKKLREENRLLRELALKYLKMLDSVCPQRDLERHLGNPHLTVKYELWDDGK